MALRHAISALRIGRSVLRVQYMETSLEVVSPIYLELFKLFLKGFLPNRSAEQNLIQIVNYISDALNDNMYCVGIFLDLKKAFDVCSHEILLKKL
jgi:hypothetical protein